MIGRGDDPLGAASSAFRSLVLAGWLPASYLLGGIGLGSLFAPALRGMADGERRAVQAALGLALLFSLSQGLGHAGLLAGAVGTALAWAPVALGLWLFGRSMPRIGAGVESAEGRFTPERIAGAAAVVAGAVMLVAAVNPPGVLWDTEFGGFDSLSYHLQLPQEWIAMGRLAPVEHNVYSFLPGYIETGFLHLAAMSGARGPSSTPGEAWGLLADGGWRALSCQLLHAGLAFIAAWVTGAATSSLIARSTPTPGPIARPAGLAAGALLLAVPWTVVVGSLSYNEMGVVLMLAAALIVAMHPTPNSRPGPWARAALGAALVGVACGFKPTALVFAAPPVAIALLANTRPKDWPAMALVGVAIGVATLAPWLVRNHLACGNPVFPYATGLFGLAHWDTEFVARYQAAHHFDGSLVERLRLLVLIDPSDPAGPRHRGLLHPQWGLFFPVVGLSGGLALADARTRRPAIVLVAGLSAQLASWLLATHLQSRFLMPMLVPGAMLVGLAAASLAVRAPAALSLASLVALGHAGLTAWTFSRQNGGAPNAAIDAGPDLFSGAALREVMPRLTPGERIAQFQDPGMAGPFLNLTLAPEARVYLLGDSTPFYITRPVVYSTTFDRSPMGEAIRRHPPRDGVDAVGAAWTRSLRERGITHVMVNLAMIDRLGKDPEVTSARVSEWASKHAEPIWVWNNGYFVVRLPENGERPKSP